MKKLALIALLLPSCVVANKSGIASLGGSGAYKSGEFALAWDHNDSFRVGSAVAGLAVGAYQAVALQKSADALSAVNSSNATKQAINASNNATKVELGAQSTSVETTKILNPAP